MWKKCLSSRGKIITFFLSLKSDYQVSVNEGKITYNELQPESTRGMWSLGGNRIVGPLEASTTYASVSTGPFSALGP